MKTLSSSFLGVTALNHVAAKCKCSLFLSYVLTFLRCILCICISLSSECGYGKNLSEIKKRERYQIPLNFIFLTFFPSHPHKVTLGNRPADGAPIFMHRSWLALSPHLGSLLLCAQHTNTIKHKLIR